jgi:hypothetical protein
VYLHSRFDRERAPNGELLIKVNSYDLISPFFCFYSDTLLLVKSATRGHDAEDCGVVGIPGELMQK